MKRINRRTLLGALSALTLGTCIGTMPEIAHAQDRYPKRPIQMIVPWPPGGVTDILARAVAPAMGEHLGQPIVIVNKAGAAGKIGTEFAAKSPADGYTIYFANSANISVAAAYEPSLRYDPVKDFAPVAAVADSPTMLAVRASLPVRNLQDLLALLKQPDTSLTFASAGEGSAYHLLGEMFKGQTNSNLLHIPYQGSAPATLAVVGEQVDLIFDAAGLKQFVDDGSIRALGVTGNDRWPLIPDVKTLNEQGLKNFEVNTWFAVLAPAGTPGEAITALNAAVNKSLSAPAVTEVLKTNGFIATGGSVADLENMLARDMKAWQDIVSTAGLRQTK